MTHFRAFHVSVSLVSRDNLMKYRTISSSSSYFRNNFFSSSKKVILAFVQIIYIHICADIQETLAQLKFVSKKFSL